MNQLNSVQQIKMSEQITKILPKSAWQKIIIHENNDPLVEVKKFFRIKRGLIPVAHKAAYFVRKQVAEKLIQASEQLPEGINLVLIEGYRPLNIQKKLWDSEFQKIKNKNPSLTIEKIKAQLKLIVAKPAPLANHHCGGAIDITLAYSDNSLMDMGPYILQTATDKNTFPMFSEHITEAQTKNRKILRDAMVASGFVWYPGEWWHYCWGDRMWAVYTNQIECFYGPIEIN